MNVSGSIPKTDMNNVYYVIGRHSEAFPNQQFPFIYSVIIMDKKQAETCSLIEETVKELQDIKRNVSLHDAARRPVHAESQHKKGFSLINRLYAKLNEIYECNSKEVLYIRAEKPHKVGDAISMTDAIEVIGLRERVKQKRV